MANRYWVGGTGTWDGTNTANWSTASGGAGGASVPTSVDAVFLDANSGTGTITIATVTAAALSLNTTGYTGTLTGTAAINLYGSLTISSGTTYTYTGSIRLNATGTLTTGGKTLSEVLVQGGTITLGSALTIAAGSWLTIIGGTLTTSASNYSITADSMSIQGGTVNLNASTVSLSGTIASNPAFQIGGTGAFNAGTSQINITGANGISASTTFYNVSFTSTSAVTSTISGANTFNNLTITPPSAAGMRQIVLATDQIVNNTLTISGASAIRRVFIRGSVIGNPRALAAASIPSPADCDFRDIVVSGLAAPITPTRAGDCGGNGGINFPAAKTVYWNLTGTQNWSATAWATTSGGTPALNNFPLAQDTAVFDNTGAATSVALENFNIGVISAGGRTTAMSFTGSNSANIYGSITFGTGVSLGATNTLTFSGTGTQTITTSNTTNFSITVEKPAGTTVNLGSAFSGLYFNLTQGTFDAVTYNVTILALTMNVGNTRTLSLGSGTWTVSGGNGTVWNLSNTTALTFNKGTADILLTGGSTSARTFNGGGLTYNKLTIGSGADNFALSLSGSNTFSELASLKTVAYTIVLVNGQTCGVWSISGSPGNVVTVQSNSTATITRVLTLSSGFVSGVDYLRFHSVAASPVSDAWYVGANSTYVTTAPNLGAGFFLTSRDVRKVFVLTSTTSTTWTVPADWKDANNEIHLIGGGGGGAGGAAGGTNRAGGGGGGGGGYTKLINQTLTPGASITYQAGAAGTAGAASGNGGAGGTTSWNSGAATAGGGGGGQVSAVTPSSTGGTGGTGSTFNGGAGGIGATTTTSNVGVGGGGGGGGGGPFGIGRVGGAGFGSTVATEIAGGGGGGGGGGTPGGNASAGSGGLGGTNYLNQGGGTSNTSGAVGGGGGGSVSTSSVGSPGVEIYGAGSGGGGGGSDDNLRINTGGLYGAGGGGGGVNITATAYAGSDGAQGAIIITYSLQTNTGNFFFMMGA